VVAITRISPHPKVPEVEQILSTGAAVQSMLLAAYAQGIGAMWRSGGMAFSEIVHRGLGLEAHESIAGFVYLGEPEGNLKSVKPLSISEFVEKWTE
jgi:nitroreductase